MLPIAAFALAMCTPGLRQSTPLEKGYAAMYNLDFARAHREFAAWEKSHPSDPMGPVSDAAAYLFSEFERLHILQSEFFTDDTAFSRRQRDLRPDAAAKQAFESALIEAQPLATVELSKNANDENALLSSVLAQGLHADYLALIEKRNLPAVSEMKQSRAVAERLLVLYPHCYDAYLAVGVENYMLSLKPAPVRWVLQLTGAETDKQAGIDRLKETAEKGHYLQPYAKLLLAVAALRDKNIPAAKNELSCLSAQFPGNRLYREELRKLEGTT